MSAQQWDAVVVGAGLGGLVCAAYLAADGRRVLVTEQHDVAGGNSHVFRRRRAYEFDVGVHYLGDCGPDGVLPAILAGVGLGGRVRFLEMDQDGFDRIELPGLTMDMPAGWQAYRERLVATLPEEAAGLNTFVDICSAVGAEMRETLLSPVEMAIQELIAATPATVAWSRRSLAELFDHCALSAAARSILAAQSPNYGMGPAQATVGTHAMVTDHYLRGAYYPEGGGQVLAASLVEVIEANGGELRTRCRVEQIVVEGGRVTGVRIRGEREHISAPLVVSNADYRRTVLELVGPEHFPAGVVKRTRAATMGMPFVTLYLGLKRPLPQRRNANVWWYDVDVDDYYKQLAAEGPDDVPFLFLSFASHKDPDSTAVCPPGHTNFQAMTLCPSDYAPWGVEEGPTHGTRYRRNPTYLESKKRMTEQMLDSAERVLGPFRDDLAHVELGTPLTHERYTLSTAGTPFGMAQWGGGSGRPDTRTTVDGLFVVGANTRYGSGITGVAVSGISCAGQILERRLLPEVHAGTVLGDPARLPDRPAVWDPLLVSRGRGRHSARGLAGIG
ncbi:NAD(P)/FAD-dependent oxidoreductase [Micromonospora sp. WMMD1120]|uniref:phytoene desaturase family protein n=1 Tax=Micromonospora sp. WMMD1120 TaxID=3016106 RepID=UPI00241633C6|nr:NAD(P)/FAD-dependent oxidoreductase [Micromonospora sp. WMMD1120]MDG4810803.1 NAD(P)/FAD-dependent oxidoreductase [Micromonospora sp. WMMD1120]